MSAAANRRHGVVTAVVHAVDAKNGSVQLEYRAIEDGLKSSWAPVAAPMSGGKRGLLFMPEVGDECLVSFENGDFNHPFVVGYLWNGKDNSPENAADQRVIVTPGGHQLRFEDKKGDTRIKLVSQGKHELLMEDAATGPMAQLKSNGGRRLTLDDTTPGKIEIVSGSNRIVLDDTPGAASIRIEAGMGAVTIALNASPPTVTVGCGANIVDIGPGAMTVTAGGNVTVNSAGTATITAAGAVMLNAGGAVTLNAPAVAINSAVTTFSGTVVAGAIVSPVYSPGIGNMV